jgi:hypothetical protein
MCVFVLWDRQSLLLNRYLTTRLYQVPRLLMSGVVPLFPLCAFMAWTGKSLPLQSTVHQKCEFTFNLPTSKNAGSCICNIANPFTCTVFSVTATHKSSLL